MKRLVTNTDAFKTHTVILLITWKKNVILLENKANQNKHKIHKINIGTLGEVCCMWGEQPTS